MRAAIIGFGNMGRKHKEVYEANGIEVSMISTTHEDTERLLDRHHLYDIVSICSPDHTHAEYTFGALRAGKSVLCEKPLATTTQELAAIAAWPLGRLHCHFPLRHVKELRDLPDLGKIYGATLAYNYGRLHKLKDTWRSQDGYSILMGGGIHMVDLACWLLGGEPQDIHTIKNPLYSKSHFRLGDILCDLTCNFTYDGAHQHCLALYGDKNSFLWTNEEEVPKGPGIQEFIDCVKNDKPMNFESAYRSHKACLEMAA